MPARRTILMAGALLLVTSLALAHDLFLKLDSYFLDPHTRVRIPVLNGTFTKSENFVSADRIADISVVTPGGRSAVVHGTVRARQPHHGV